MLATPNAPIKMENPPITQPATAITLKSWDKLCHKFFFVCLRMLVHYYGGRCAFKIYKISYKRQGNDDGIVIDNRVKHRFSFLLDQPYNTDCIASNLNVAVNRRYPVRKQFFRQDI